MVVYLLHSLFGDGKRLVVFRGDLLGVLQQTPDLAAHGVKLLETFGDRAHIFLYRSDVLGVCLGIAKYLFGFLGDGSSELRRLRGKSIHLRHGVHQRSGDLRGFFAKHILLFGAHKRPQHRGGALAQHGKNQRYCEQDHRSGQNAEQHDPL